MVSPHPQGFASLDEPDVYEKLHKSLEEIGTHNFVVEFDKTNAYAALNLQSTSLRHFLKAERPKGTTTRWINIFGPERQPDCIAAIAAKYDLSPRLRGIISTKPRTPQRAFTASSKSRPPAQHADLHDGDVYTAIKSSVSDPEKEGLSNDDANVSAGSDIDFNHYSIVDEVWHFYSADWTPKCLCIGYNSLSDTALGSAQRAETEQTPKKKRRSKYKRAKKSNENVTKDYHSKPEGKRVWMWLMLCEDDTVISIQENPFPACRDSLDDGQKATLVLVRRNLYNVIANLSKINEDWRKNNPINILDIRPGFQISHGITVTMQESPELLFYYIFDDWWTTYNLVARKEQQYAYVLDDIREQMFATAELSHVQQLHQTGRQLAVLRRMYESYAVLIERILDRQKIASRIQSKNRNKIPGHAAHQSPQSDASRSANEHPQHDVENRLSLRPLTSKATDKFERLKDRIELYALSEIEECQKEKEDLTFLNFNVMTMRQSEAVEKLTRITILLAKVTILFMPVSLMTGYFSVQIQELEGVYTAKTYWVCFVVVMSLSFAFLVGFGIISHTLEGKVVYRSIPQASRAGIRKAFQATRRPGKNDRADGDAQRQ